MVTRNYKFNVEIKFTPVAEFVKLNFRVVLNITCGMISLKYDVLSCNGSEGGTILGVIM